MTSQGMFDIGTEVTLEADFTNLAGAAADPGTVTCTVLKPDGTEATPTPASTVTGIWTAAVVVDQSGLWSFRFAGSDGLTVASEGVFLVRTRRVPAVP